ncbi:MAG: hypothetical protein H6741_08375 [Alphaproteobacteria bacterium]|nr:hypothetical protein [Alphaproteobacteria bacterium]MCB9792732.1 hypothetical protein [Alphaproteobacteria bacterium]
MARPIPGFARASTPPAYAPDPELEPVALDLAVRVDLETQRLEGELTWTVKSRRAGARQLRLDAIDFEHIEVLSEGVASRYDGEALHLSWPEAVPVGEARQLRLRWAVQQPMSGLIFGDAPYRYMASDHETSRARYWLPCVDHPVVRTQVQVAITADAGLTALSAGAQLSRVDNGDGTATTSYRLEHLCPAYLLCLAVGDFAVYDDGQWRGRPVRAYAPKPHTVADLARAFGPTKQMLEYLSEKLGVEMPWPKYEQFAVAKIGGAMENVSLVSWDDLFLPDERAHAEMGWLIDIINLHEMAHTWFGDLVVCREFAHAWLKESWATYMESVWLEDTEGPEAMDGQLYDEAYAYTSESDGSYARPIVTRHFESGWDMFDGHLYPGGALRLHVLRKEIGDAVFWAAVRDYLQRFQGQVVDTADFRKVMERHSGRNLNAFFDQWFMSPGYPKLSVSFNHDPKLEVASLTVTQTQEDKDKGIGLFDMALVVAVQRADGHWTRHSLRLEERVTALTWSAAEAPLQVILDPDTDALFNVDFNPGRDMLVRALSAPSVRGRIHAAQTLCDKHGRAGILEVQQAWAGEPQWRVRRAWARALGASAHLSAARALGELLHQEQDARVLTLIGQACEKHQAPELADAMARWLEGEGRPYRAAGHVLTALGRQRGDAHLALLQRFTQEDPSWGWLQRGAFAGLGHTWTAEAVEHIAQALDDPGLRRSARIGALSAYAEGAATQDRATRQRAVDRLARLGRHADYGTRMAAAWALIALGEASGAGKVRQIAERISVQDRPRVERGAARLSKSGDAAATSKQLETLSAKLRTLEEELEKLTAQVNKAD